MTQMRTHRISGRALTHALFVLLLALYLWVFRTTLINLVGVWSGDGTFQYAFLIVPITLFLIWSRREEIASRDFFPSSIGLTLMAGCALLWLIGELVGVLLVQHFAVVAFVPSLVLAMYGPAVGRALLFPLVYLFFAFPWPVSGVTALLQNITAEFSVRALQLSGFTALLKGLYIDTPFSSWHVAEACSGIKFFIASLALGALYANLFYRSWLRRAVFMVFAFIVPIVANGFRVYFTVVIGEVFGLQYATGTDHLIFGWQFFGTVLLLLFLVAWRWREAPPPFESPPAVVWIAPVQRILPGAVMAALLLLLGPVVGWALLPNASAVAAAPETPPQRLGVWRLLLPDANPLGARYREPDIDFSGTYANGPRHVNLVVLRYEGRPREGHKLFMAGNRLYSSGEWWPAGKRRTYRPSGLHAVRELRLSSGGQRRLVWYWYEVGSHMATNSVRVKLRQLLDGLHGTRMSTGIVILSVPLFSEEGDGEAEKTLQSFMQAYLAHGRRR